jgi:S1-C subfamily serine protease
LPLVSAPYRRRRSLVLMAIAVGAVAVGAAVIGIVLQPAAGARSSPVLAAVVGVSARLTGGGSGAATGVIITRTGELVTTYHGIDGALGITVGVPSRRATYPASIVGLDPADDLALLQVQGAPDLPAAPTGNAAALSVGARVTAVARPAGTAAPPIETQGDVTATDQAADVTDPASGNSYTLSGLVKIDIPVQPTDAGGPLLDSAGRLAGLELPTPDQPGTAFAIPIATVTTVIHDAVAGGGTNPGVLRGAAAVLGVETGDSTTPPGALVVGVDPASPAEAVGVVKGDVITMVDAAAVTSAQTLSDDMHAFRAGQRIDVRWLTPSGQVRVAMVWLAAGTLS